jgi:filamentous hemagglutinin
MCVNHTFLCETPTAAIGASNTPRLQPAEMLSPVVNGLLADPVLLGNLRDRRLVRLAQDGSHLFLGEPAFLHDFLLSVGSHSLKFQLVRKSPGRS